jgi:hypothetical protein
MQLSAYGMSCTLPTGWSGYIYKTEDGSDDINPPCLHATTGTLPADPTGDDLGVGVTDSLTANQAFISCMEVYADDVIVPGQGVFAPSALPSTLTLADFDANLPLADDPVSSTLVGAQKAATVNGRPCSLYVVLGSPLQSLVDAVNGIVRTIAMDSTNDRYKRLVTETPHILSYWRLGETSGTMAADAQYTNPGTYQGVCTRGASPLIVRSGDPALQLAGTGGVVKVVGSGFDFFDAFTIEAWIKAATLSPARQIVARKFGTWQLAVLSQGQLELTLTTPAGTTVTCTSAAGVIAVATTHHVAATLGGPVIGPNNAKMCQLYVDGNNVATGSVATPLGT